MFMNQKDAQNRESKLLFTLVELVDTVFTSANSWWDGLNQLLVPVDILSYYN